MRTLAFLGLLASSALVPGGAMAQSESTAAASSAAVATIVGAQRSAPRAAAGRAMNRARNMRRGGMRGMRGGNRGGHGMRGGNRGGNRTNIRIGGQRQSVNVGGSRTNVNVGGSRAIARGGNAQSNVFVGGNRFVNRGGGGRNGVRGGYRGGRDGMRGGRGGRGGFRGNRGFGRDTQFFVGGFLPSYFLAPQYYVNNYANYGLAQPSYGHRWVRYYDDAYLVDGRGYIADYRYGVPYGGGGYAYPSGGYGGGYYDRGYEGGYYDDGYGRGNDGSTAAGAVIGGVVGGIAGNRIAGRGNRTEGTIIGGAVGAIAGGLIGNAAGDSRRGGGRYGTSYGHGGYDGYQGGGDPRYYEGRRAAHGHSAHHGAPHDRGPVPEYVGNGDYYPQMDYRTHGQDYQVEREVIYQPAPQPVYRAPARPAINTNVHVSGGHPGVTTHHASNGITQTATTNINIRSVPATTTTTFIEETVEYVAPRRASRRSTRRAHRPRRTNGCNC